jgi:hypothetical protein
VTLIEVHINEDESRLGKLIKDSYTAIYQQALPNVAFGRVIVWNGRMFQELKPPNGTDPDFISYEDRLLHCWNLPRDRARMQLGSVRGEIFTTPPETGNELAARIKEGGRCGKEYMVRPFRYYDYHCDP